MVPIFLGLALWYPAVLGWGFPFSKMIGEYDPDDRPLYAALGGMAILAAVVNGLSFFWPIYSGVALLFLGIGWVAFIVAQWRWQWWPRLSIKGLFFIGVLLANISVVAAQSPLNYETGLYHLQSVKWLTTSTVPFGLANLLGQFGFNSAWFSFAAALEVPWLQGQSVFLANSLMLLVFGVAVGQAAAKFWVPHQVRLAHTFLLICVLPWVNAMMGINVNSLSADLPITFLTLLMSYLLIKALQNLETVWAALPGLAFIAAFAIAVKLSAAPLSLFAISLVGLVIYHRPAFISKQMGVRCGQFVLVSCSLLLIPWLLRNVALSGCLVYPVAVTCSPKLAWGLPMAAVERDIAFVQSWARRDWSEADRVSSNWVGVIHQVTPNTLFVLGVVGCVAGAMYWIAKRKNSRRPDTPFRYWLPVVALLLGIGFWLATVPDVRFGEGYFWSLGLYGFSLGLYRFYQAYALKGFEKFILVAGSALAIFVAFIWPLFLPVGWGADKYWIANQPQLRLSRSQLVWQWPPIPKVRLIRHFVGGGYLYTPIISFPCWDAPLPCAPGYDPQVRVRFLDADLPRIVVEATPP